MIFTVYQTGRRYRITLLTGAVTEHLGTLVNSAPPNAASRSPATGTAVGDRHRGVRNRARPLHQPTHDFDQIAEAARRDYRHYLDTVAPWRDDRTPAAELAAYVLWSADRPRRRLRHPPRRADVQALDGQGVELGPLLQRHRPRRRLARAWPGTSSACPSTTRKPPGRSPTRSPTPKSSTTSSNRPSTAGPCGHLARPPPRQERSDAYRLLERWTTFWLDRPPRPRPRTRPLPARQRQRMGQRHHLRPRPRRRDRRPGRLPRPPDARPSPTSPPNSASPDEATRWTRAADRMREAMLTQLWHDDRFTTRSAGSDDTWTSSSLLDLMPIVLGEELPHHVQTAARRQDQDPPHRIRPRHRTADLPALPGRRLLARPHLGPSTVLIEDGLRRAGQTGLGRRGQRPLPRPVREVGIRGELRRPHRRGTPRPRLHLDRQRLPHPGRRPRPPDVLTDVSPGSGPSSHEPGNAPERGSPVGAGLVLCTKINLATTRRLYSRLLGGSPADLPPDREALAGSGPGTVRGSCGFRHSPGVKCHHIGSRG